MVLTVLLERKSNSLRLLARLFSFAQTLPLLYIHKDLYGYLNTVKWNVLMIFISMINDDKLNRNMMIKLKMKRDWISGNKEKQGEENPVVGLRPSVIQVV